MNIFIDQRLKGDENEDIYVFDNFFEKCPSIELHIPFSDQAINFNANEVYPLTLEVKSEEEYIEEHSLELQIEINENYTIFKVIEDLEVDASHYISPEEIPFLSKELLNQTMYRKMARNPKYTKQEINALEIMERITLKTKNHRIKKSDIEKIRESSVPLARLDQIFRVCNDFNFFSDNVNFFPKISKVKCGKSGNSFEIERIHISNSFILPNFLNNDMNQHRKKLKNLNEKIKKVGIILLLYGKFFKRIIKNLILMTDEEKEKEIDDKIRAKQERLLDKIEVFCKQMNKISI
jgi:hypothetical protein